MVRLPPSRPRGRFLRRLLAWAGGALALLLAALVGVGWLTGAADAASQNALAHDALPFYGDASLRPRWDTWASWQRTAAFALDSQHDRPVTEQDMAGHATVLGFFYAGCVTTCPVSTQLLRLLDTQLHGEGGPAAAAPPRFVLLSLTPELDRPRDLAGYAERLQLPAGWTLLTGTPAGMGRLTASLWTDTSLRLPGGEPLHAERVFLLDGKRRIRGIYTAASTVEMRRLANDYRRLLAEQQAGTTVAAVATEQSAH